MAEQSSSGAAKRRDTAWMVSIVLSCATLASLLLGAGIIVGRIQSGVDATAKIAIDLKDYATSTLEITRRSDVERNNLKVKIAELVVEQREIARRLDSCCPRGSR